MLLGELCDHGLGMLDNISVAAVGGGAAAVARERLRAAVEHDLVSHCVAHDGAVDHRGTVSERAVATVESIHIVVDGGAGADLRDLRHEVRLEGRGRRPPGDDAPAEAVAIEGVDRFRELCGHERERSGLLGGGRPDMARIEEDAIEPQARRGSDLAGEGHECDSRRHARPPHAHVEIDEHAHRHARGTRRRGNSCDCCRRIECDANLGRTGERCQPRRSWFVHGGVGHEDVGPAVSECRQQSLGLADLGHGEPVGSGGELQPGDVDALVRLRVRPNGDAVSRCKDGQPFDVAPDRGGIDDDSRRREPVNAEAGVGSRQMEGGLIVSERAGRHAASMAPPGPPLVVSRPSWPH